MCNHIALILDGNRRWGKKHGLSLSKAYCKGGEVLKDIVLELITLKIPFATMYGFSFENWNRSLYEISVIMVSFLSFLNEHKNFFMDNDVKVKFIGDLSFFDANICSILMELENMTKNNKRILIQLAVSYSGRNEILNAAYSMGKNSISFNEALYTAGIPDPDLLIRTGGCNRLSNFLLWQVAYTELYFLDKLWPDFTKEDLHEILKNYEGIQKNRGE